VSETATDLILGGIAFGSIPTVDFQTSLLSLLLFREKTFEDCAQKLPDEKILIVCDRGALDGKAYLPAEEFAEVLSRLNTNEVELRDRYDAVFHLVSPADDAVDAYSTEQNEARTEAPEQAAILDRLVLEAWTGHPHLRVIDSTIDFEEKMRMLTREISRFLEQPDHYEVERKFLIAYPDLEHLNTLPTCQKTDIFQAYLLSPDSNTELRIRQQGTDGQYTYTKTEKRRLSNTKKVESGKRLSKSEYLTLLMDTDTSLHQVRKIRYCLMSNRQYFKIDVYPFWSNQAVAKVKLANGDEQINFPEFLKILREVTGEEQYKDYSLAKEHPEEEGTITV
jgi:CYTH domain-containing protein